MRKCQWHIFVTILFLCDLIIADEPVVNVQDGKIQGTIMRDRYDKEFYSFQSIPYAKPPIGKLRFKAPQPSEPWNNTLNATKTAPVCLQYEFDRIIGTEDCLYLNVYTPKLVPEFKLPVMVYIHGGAYFEGSGSYENYGPEYLMTEEVVLVTINYRLGRFGSISFKNQSLGVPGNAHLKDQVMALKWVRDNIQNFGGDSNCVTIFGESVGGSSVHMHMLSPMSKGLFHRAISQSGLALNVWNVGTLNSGQVVGEQLGLQTADTELLIRQLQELSVEKIMETQGKDGLGVPVHQKFEYSPVVEAQTNEPAFLVEPPIKTIESGNYANVPYIMGYNNRDSLIFQVVNRLYFGKPFYITDFSLVIPHDLNITSEDEKKEVIEELIKEFYGSTRDYADIDKFTDLSMGAWGIASYYRALIRHVKNSKSRLYYYVFSADTKLNFFKRLHPVTAKMKGASHMDELGYLFKTKYSPCIEDGSSEDLALNNMIKLWTNFAKYGNPTPSNNTLGAIWLPVTRSAFNYLQIDTKLRPGLDPDSKIVNFWHNLYKKYNGD